jgi:hypothetical protein
MSSKDSFIRNQRRAAGQLNPRSSIARLRPRRSEKYTPQPRGKLWRRARRFADAAPQAVHARARRGSTLFRDIGREQFQDVGNFKQDDQAAVSTNFIAGLLAAFPLAKPGDKSMTIDFAAEYMAVLISHEFGHIAGAFHTQFTFENSFHGEPVTLMDKDIRVPLGPDLIFGTRDDITMHFGVDEYDPNEIYAGIDDTLNTVAFGLSTGTVRTHRGGGGNSGTLWSSGVRADAGTSLLDDFDAERDEPASR